MVMQLKSASEDIFMTLCMSILQLFKNVYLGGLYKKFVDYFV